MKKYFLILSLLFPYCLWAQTNPEPQPLESDRPDKTQSPTVVPRKSVQIETGLEYQKDELESDVQFTTKELLYPTLLIRIGVLKWAELRINTDYKREWEDNGGTPTLQPLPDFRGFSDVQIGTKVKIKEGKGLIPTIGFLGNLTLPVGHKEFSPPKVAPEGHLLFSNKISEKVELVYNVGYRKRQEQNEFNGEAVYTVSGNFKLTDKISFFAETFAHKPIGETAEYNADTGFLFLILPNLQFDIVGGLGINEASPDSFVGGGLTWRIPR